MWPGEANIYIRKSYVFLSEVGVATIALSLYYVAYSVTKPWGDFHWSDANNHIQFVKIGFHYKINKSIYISVENIADFNSKNSKKWKVVKINIYFTLIEKFKS